MSNLFKLDIIYICPKWVRCKKRKVRLVRRDQM